MPIRPLSALNYAGRPVSLAGGPILASAATAAAALGALASGGRGRRRLAAAAVVAGAIAGAVGRYDDSVSHRPGHQAKGIAGHVQALRAARPTGSGGAASGRVTSGTVKAAGLAAAGLIASACLPRTASSRRARTAELLVGAGVIAGTANLVNLFDLRPGRALKFAVALAATQPGEVVVVGPALAALAVLPADLDERIMIGDCGANSLGALVGLGLARRTGLRGRASILIALTALTLASEKVSFTRVIDATPMLRVLDQWGRQPVPSRHHE